MIQLYGLRLSNFYGLTKALLIEKGLAFEEVKTPPSQEEEFLALSPMGKMPAIGVDGKYLSESLAIATYLDRLQPEPALLPQDPFAAAKVMELVCHIKFDVDFVARRCLFEALFGQSVSDETKESTKRDLPKGMAAVRRLIVCDPYAAGSEMTLADYYAYFCFGLANVISQKMFDVDILAGHEDIQALMARLAEHPSIARVEADRAG